MEHRQLTPLEQRVAGHLQILYPDLDNGEFAKRCLQQFGLAADTPSPMPHRNLWDQSDVMAITYGDSLRRENESPLQTLLVFLSNHMQDCVSTVHILPFFPYSSDKGFSITDFEEVDPKLGTWGPGLEIKPRDLIPRPCSLLYGRGRATIRRGP